jgi:hypothetical protein
LENIVVGRKLKRILHKQITREWSIFISLWTKTVQGLSIYRTLSEYAIEEIKLHRGGEY